MNDQQWRSRQDARQRAADALRGVRKSTHLPTGLHRLTDANAAQIETVEIRRDTESGWAEP
jgi:hypothetical protein